MGTMTVSLYKDSNLKSNTKYRTGGLANSTPIVTLTAVSNGAIANKNIYADNSVEISTPIETAGTANYITLTIGTTCIVGEITGMDYINDNNTNINYAIDYFTTAQMTAALRGEFFTGVFGHCERTNLTYPAESVVNLQPEPYQGGDYMEPEIDFTRQINQDLGASMEVDMGNINSSIFFRGYVAVLWISSFAAQVALECGSANVGPWRADCSPPTPGVHIKPDFSSTIPANNTWYGGVSTGCPLTFTGANAMDKLSDFVNALLGECGIQVIYPPQGLSEDGTIRRFVTVTPDNMFYPEPDDPEEYTTEMTQVRLVGAEDILRIQILPGAYRNGSTDPSFRTFPLTTGYDLSNFNPLIDEKTVVLPDGTIVYDYSKSKLMTYPYWYFKLLTATGDCITILPQRHMSVSNYINTFNINIWYKFTGGDRPTLQVCVLSAEEIEAGTRPDSPGATVTWYTVYQFPTIAWAADVSTEQQLAAIQAQVARYGEMQAAIIGASTKGTGFQYGIRGGEANRASQGTLRAAVTSVGNWLGSSDEVFSRAAYTNDFGGGSAKYLNELAASLGQSEAGRIMQSSNFQSTGGDSIAELCSQPLRMFRCGMSYGELFGFGRFIDRQGQSCHLNGNPITNSFNVFGGNASITSYAGKTWYQFSDCDVTGTMPVDFKNAIQLMFCGGCYLMN